MEEAHGIKHEMARSRRRRLWKVRPIHFIRITPFSRIEAKSKLESDPGTKLQWKEFGKSLLNVVFCILW